MNRRAFLRSGAVTTAALGGCAGLPSLRDGPRPVRVTAVDVLNRHAESFGFQFVAEFDDVPIRVESRTIEGTTNASRPTGIEFAPWPDEPGQYRFSMRLDDRSWMRVEPRDTGISEENANCYRMVFVIGLRGELTALAQTDCEGA